MDSKFRGSEAVSSRFLFPTAGSEPFTNGSASSSPGKSVVGSTETESEEDVNLLSELTRQLALLDGQNFAPTRPSDEMNLVQTGSPQSTLLHMEIFSGRTTGSSNGPFQVSSPPSTPLSRNNCSWDLIYRASGQVEDLKSNTAGGLASSNASAIFQRHGTFSSLPPSKSSVHSYVHPNYHVRGEPLLGREMYGVRNGQVGKGPNTLNTTQKIGGIAGSSGGGQPCLNGGYPNKNDLQMGPCARGCGFHVGSVGYGVGHGYGYGSVNRVQVGGGVVVKSKRVGTGVFLPRRYDEKSIANSSCNAVDSRKKSAKKVPLMSKKCSNKSACTACHSKNFVHDTMSMTITDYDILLTRRRMSGYVSVPILKNGFSEGPIHHEISLPQEWTY